MSNKPRILVVGPVCNISGYSEHARTLVDSFMEMEDHIDLYIQDTQWASSSKSLKYFNKYKHLITKTAQLFQQRVDQQGRVNIAGLFESTYQVRPPNEFEQMSPNDVGVTAAVETTFAPPEWVSKCNMMSKILVVSEHAKTNLKNTKDNEGNKITTPISVIPFGYDTSIEKTDIFQGMDITTKFNFLTVLQMAPRKNFDTMLKWFVEEFKDNEDVGLFIKTHMHNNSTLDFHGVKARVEHLLNAISKERKCKVYLIHGNLTESQMHSLYNPEYVDCYITATHGEGFGIPMFHAACNNIPVVATNWSGHLDFLRAPAKTRAGNNKIKSHFLKTTYDIKKVQPHHLMPGLINQECEWAYPKEESFKKNMRFVLKSKQSLVEDSQRLKEHLLTNFSIDNVKQKYKKFLANNSSLVTYDDVRTEDIPKISILTSVYDGDEYIREFLENITQQTIFEEKCELVIVNANSPGNEEPVIFEYMEKYPDNILYKKLDKDPGIYGVWNECIRMSSGEFLTNANLDDRKSLNSIEMHAKGLMTHQDVDLVYSDMLVTDKPNETFENNSSEGRKYQTPEFSFNMLKMMNMPHAAPLWKKSIHEKHGFFDEKYKSAGDWEMWLRAASQGSKFKKLPFSLNLYYFNPKGISTNKENFSWKREEEMDVSNKYKDVNVGE